jgi:glucokinase
MTSNPGKSALVYDVGGSHVAAAVCCEHGYRLGPVISSPHPGEGTSEAFISLLHRLGLQASADDGTRLDVIAGAALAFPGPFDFTAGISWMKHKLPYLYGVDLRGELAARFGWQPLQVRFLLDSAAFLKGEIGAGAAKGVTRVVGITLGTGIGSAFAVDGHLVIDGPGVPPRGEVWDLPYDGKILEESVSTRAIKGTYERLTGKTREVAELAGIVDSDSAAAEAFHEFGRHLGLALNGALQVFAPQVIVLGGGISRSPELFLPAAQKELKDVQAEFRVSTLLDNAALAGAGVEFFSHFATEGAQPVEEATQVSAD